MDKYKNNTTGKIAIVTSFYAAGMCRHTIGKTLVIYKYENENLNYPFVMETNEFHQTHTLI